MAKISKPGTNPIVAALLCLILQLGHLVINGQKKKWLIILACTFIGLLACCVGSPIVAILGIIEAYKTGQKLQAGKEIDEHEYSFAPMYKIAKYLHKEAILVP